jgi:hypothetical protein
VTEDRLEDRRFLSDLLRRGCRDDDRLRVDHLAHDASARVGRGHQAYDPLHSFALSTCQIGISAPS